MVPGYPHWLNQYKVALCLNNRNPPFGLLFSDSVTLILLFPNSSSAAQLLDGSEWASTYLWHPSDDNHMSRPSDQWNWQWKLSMFCTCRQRQSCQLGVDTKMTHHDCASWDYVHHRHATDQQPPLPWMFVPGDYLEWRQHCGGQPCCCYGDAQYLTSRSDLANGSVVFDCEVAVDWYCHHG